jgi:hypothetical protein
MKRHLLLMPVILATTAALADAQAITPSSRGDAQAQAAALLSGVRHGSQARTNAQVVEPSRARPAADAHAQAAALLSGVHYGSHARTMARAVEKSRSRPSADAQAQAAALLSGYRASMQSQVQAERTQAAAGARRAK